MERRVLMIETCMEVVCVKESPPVSKQTACHDGDEKLHDSSTCHNDESECDNQTARYDMSEDEPRPLFLQRNLLLQPRVPLLFLQRNNLLVLLRALLQPRVLPSLLQPIVQVMMQPRLHVMSQLVQARMLLLIIAGQGSGKWLRVQSKGLSTSPRRKVNHQHGLSTTHITNMDHQC
jgi:hypothetical protein